MTQQPTGRENFAKELKEWVETIRDQLRNDEKYFDDLGKDYLYDRGKCAGVAIFIEQEVRRKIESLRVGKEE